MNVAVVVIGCMAGSGSVVVSLHVCTTSAIDVRCDVPVDFAASATVMRTRITDRARQVLIDMGVAGADTATYRLFGGPS